MRTINKGPEPFSLTAWKRANSQKNYTNLDKSICRDIREQALKEQFYLCAYCCQRIQDIDACHNEHVEAQSINPKRTVDFTNIVASCNTPNQCGKAHKSDVLSLTPLMAECETELRFKINGRVEGLSERATDTIKTLNLGDHERNNRALVEKRKQLSNVLLWKSYGASSPELEEEDEDILNALIEELAQPQQDKLEPFAPVVINIVINILKSRATI